jgi:hypothetical protein
VAAGRYYYFNRLDCPHRRMSLTDEISTCEFRIRLFPLARYMRRFLTASFDRGKNHGLRGSEELTPARPHGISKPQPWDHAWITCVCFGEGNSNPRASQLLGVGTSLAGTTHLTRNGQLQIEHIVGRERATVPASGCFGVGAIHNFFEGHN